MSELKENCDTMNIAFTCNNAYIKYVSVTMISILENNPNSKIHFYIICNDCSKYSKQCIDLLRKQYFFEITYLSVDIDKFSEIRRNHSAHVSNETNYRYFVADLIPEVDKLLFLDGDLIINSSIEQLYQTNIENYHTAVAKDPLDRNCKHPRLGNLWWFEEFNIPKQYPYLNTGVFLINMNKWRKDNFGTKLIETAKYWGKKFLFPDQDAINVLCYDKNFLLEQKYNYCCELHWDNLNDRTVAEQNAVVYHWAGPNKPWSNPTCNYANLFWKYARKSPFYEEILFRNIKNTPSATKELLSGVYNYRKNMFKYYRYKVLSKITFGKTRKKYKQKRKDLKLRLNKIREFIKG